MENISACLKRMLLEKPGETPGEEKEPETGAEALARVAFQAALKGNDKFFKLVRDLTEDDAAAADTSVVFRFETGEGVEE